MNAIYYDPGMREQLRINLGGLHRANTYARQDNLTTGIAIGTVPQHQRSPRPELGLCLRRQQKPCFGHHRRYHEWREFHHRFKILKTV